jgi:hypothetical protein
MKFVKYIFLSFCLDYFIGMVKTLKCKRLLQVFNCKGELPINHPQKRDTGKVNSSELCLGEVG